MLLLLLLLLLAYYRSLLLRDQLRMCVLDLEMVVALVAWLPKRSYPFFFSAVIRSSSSFPCTSASVFIRLDSCCPSVRPSVLLAPV
uniref:Putative secreted protein n=1 Tax=Anopheles darlingi TaxID=43151 RepID=A0A2M4D1W4_ANODA